MLIKTELDVLTPFGNCIKSLMVMLPNVLRGCFCQDIQTKFCCFSYCLTHFGVKHSLFILIILKILSWTNTQYFVSFLTIWNFFLFSQRLTSIRTGNVQFNTWRTPSIAAVASMIPIQIQESQNQQSQQRQEQQLHKLQQK